MNSWRRGMVIYGVGMIAIWLMGTVFVLAMSIPSTTVERDQVVFVTNTPPPINLMNQAIDGRIDQYAVRTWQEAELVNVLIQQLNQLAQGNYLQMDAIPYTLLELEQRFPQAPTDVTLRGRVVDAMLAVPAGSVDMRGMVRPYITEVFNRQISDGYQPQTNVPFRVEGWEFDVQFARLTPDDVLDVVLSFSYRDLQGQLIYGDTIPLFAENGRYILPNVESIPAQVATWTDGIRVEFVMLKEIVGGGLMSLLYQQTDTSALAPTWLIYGWRDGDLINLAQPNTTMTGYDFRDGLTPSGERQITVKPARMESERWNCISTTEQVWIYRANFIRPESTGNAIYTPQPSVGCSLYTAEPPLFSRPPEAAIAFVSGVLAVNPVESSGYIQGQIALAMLYILNGQTEQALDVLAYVTAEFSDDAYALGQVMALQGADWNHPIQTCAALLVENPQGACEIDLVIERVLTDTPIVRSGDLQGQLAIIGLPVNEIVLVRAVGQAERHYVKFDLAGASWWVFAPTDPNFYVATAGNPPPDFVEPSLPLITSPLEVPLYVAEALFFDRDPMTALTLLEDSGDDRPLSVEARYFRAFALDLQGHRADARDAYYALWVEFPDSVWGRLAGAHLEPRLGGN